MFELGSIVGNSKWTGKIIHQSPHTITVETINSEGIRKIYKRKRKELKLLEYFNEFKIGDRCYVFNCYNTILDYDNVLFTGYDIKEAIVIDTSNYKFSIKLLNDTNEHQYKLIYENENDIKTNLIHRNKFLGDLDVGRYGTIKIDKIINNSNIRVTGIYDNNGYTRKSWILALNKKNNILCCLTHYDCDIEKCKYPNKDNKYLVTFTKLDKFEYCRDNGCVVDSIENRKHFATICSRIYNKYIDEHLIKQIENPTALIIKTL
jgi:hypothetical protein